jgi:hypothetical protein
VWSLAEPEVFAPARALDRVLFALRRPSEPAVTFKPDGGVARSELASLGASLVGRLSRLL